MAKGELFSWISWDDEINLNYCNSIYKKYKKTGCKAFAPIPKAIDIESRILKKRTSDLAKSFQIKGDTINSINVIKSKICINKDNLFLSPGELLSFERH